MECVNFIVIYFVNLLIVSKTVGIRSPCCMTSEDAKRLDGGIDKVSVFCQGEWCPSALHDAYG